MNPSSSAILAKNEICGRLGEEEELLHAFHVASASEAACAYGDQRLVDVESSALRIGLGVKEDQHALAAKGNHQEQNGEARKSRTDADKEILPLHPGQHQHHRRHAGQHQRRAQVQAA